MPSNTPFPLGLFIGGLAGANDPQTQQVDQAYGDFKSLMGTGVQFMDTYIDQTKPISQWGSNASYTAWTWAQDPNFQGTTPLIGLPMTSSAMGLSPDQFYQNWANGAYNDQIYNMV